MLGCVGSALYAGRMLPRRNGRTLSPVEPDIVLKEEFIHYDASSAGSKGIE